MYLSILVKNDLVIFKNIVCSFDLIFTSFLYLYILYYIHFTVFKNILNWKYDKTILIFTIIYKTYPNVTPALVILLYCVFIKLLFANPSPHHSSVNLHYCECHQLPNTWTFVPLSFINTFSRSCHWIFPVAMH